jgi:MoxR-like ATPase
VIATQNPIELEGTFPLPEAQLDRFLIRLRLGYPEESEEEEMLLRFEGADPLAQLKPVTTAQEVLEFQGLVQRVYIDPVLRTYLVRVVQATRRHPEVELGASPRATMGLYRCSQALAAIRGREYVTPDEIKALAPYALSHRVILKSQARLRERTPAAIIGEILDQVQIPV